MAKKYQFDTFMELIAAVMADGMMTNAKNMLADKEAKAAANKAMIAPYINRQNISLLINDGNINKLRTAIIEKALPAMDKHFIFYAEPTADKKNVRWSVSYRPDGGNDALVLPLHSGYITDITQQQIFTLISKFLPNGNTDTGQQ